MFLLSGSLSPLRLTLTVSLLASLIFLGGSGTPALAEPVQTDRSDNTYYFTYDADKGEMTAEASSLQEKRRNPISQRVYIDTIPGAEVGRRIKATILFKLNAQTKRAFRGELAVEIRDATTQIVNRCVGDVNFVLRPKKGLRSARFVARFDLPSGDYSAQSVFNASS